MKAFACLFLFVLILTGCTNETGATALLKSQGYTNIKMTGYRFLSCGEDTVSTGLIATNPAGHPTTGVVCESFFKSKTIRFN